MNIEESVTPQVLTVYGLFESTKFRVPSYQRGYSWEAEQIEDLCDDLDSILESINNNEEPHHFFGQVVTFRDSAFDTQELIDGQQRLTTSQLLLSVIEQQANALSEKMDEMKNPLYKRLYAISYKTSEATKNGEELLIEKSNSENENGEVFKAYVQHGSYEGEIQHYSKPIKNIENAYKILSRWVAHKLAKQDLAQQVNTLELIANTFGKLFYFVKVFTPNRHDAFTIFETLNSRGRDLTSSDIIKSHILSLLSNSDQASQKANNIWNQISTFLNEDSDKVNSFIRSYWAAKRRLVKSKNLYRDVSKDVDNSDSAMLFLTEARDLVQLYNYMSNIGTSHFRKNNTDNPYRDTIAARSFKILSRLDFKLYYPIVFAMAHNQFSAADVYKVMNEVISVFIRFRFIAGRTTNKLEHGLSSIAIKVWSGMYNDVDSINNELKHLVSDVLSRDAIKSSFEQLSKEGGFKRNKKWGLTYLFSKLYEDSFIEYDEAYNEVINKDKYTLIHIAEEGQVDSEYLNYIGNWTIIEKDIAPNEFDNPINTIYGWLIQSKLKANRDLAAAIKRNGFQWTSADIQNRQRAFAQDAVTIWQ